MLPIRRMKAPSHKKVTQVCLAYLNESLKEIRLPKINVHSWRKAVDFIKQSWQQNKQVEGKHEYSHTEKQKVSNHQSLEMQILLTTKSYFILNFCHNTKEKTSIGTTKHLHICFSHLELNCPLEQSSMILTFSDPNPRCRALLLLSCYSLATLSFFQRFVSPNLQTFLLA